MQGGSIKKLKIYVWLAGLALGIGALVSYLALAFPSFNNRLENAIFDAWQRLSAEAPGYTKVAVIDIDEASMRKIGQLPWPRTILSDLINMLLVQGVEAIGLDIWLTEPDRSSPIAVDGQLEKNFGLNLDFTKLPAAVLDNDRYFKDTIVGKPVVLGAWATFGKGGDFPANMPAPVEILEVGENGGKMPGGEIAEIGGLVPPIPVLANAARVGLLNVAVQNDGIVRSLPLLARAGDNFYPALSLQTLMAARGVNKLKLSANWDGADTLFLGDLEIPIEKDGSFRPLYYGPARTFPYYSAADILDGKIGRKELEGKIVFVGPSAHTLMNASSTPLDPSVPGAEIHATIAENLLSGQNIRTHPHSSEIQVIIIFISAFIGVAIFHFLTLPVYAPVFLTLVFTYGYVSWLCFLNGILFSPCGAILALLMAALVILPFRYWHAQREKRKLHKAFAQYVAPEVVSRIVSGGEDLLKGQQKEVSVMFTDVRGFTTIAEKLSPQELVRLLNCYFTPMTACVTSRQGTLDKFIGDALMAFWNAPLNIKRHAFLAVQAARDMQNSLAELRPDLKKEFGIDLQMGIGINTGLAHVGNMGSTDLLDYTCIGDNVNLASRLEGMCKRYGVNIVVSDSVKKACADDFTFLPLDQIRVKGSDKPLRIYAPLSDSAALSPVQMEQWEQALLAYFHGSFSDAKIMFAKFADNPFLRIGAALFGERCASLERTPGLHWDGVWTYKEK